MEKIEEENQVVKPLKTKLLEAVNRVLKINKTEDTKKIKKYVKKATSKIAKWALKKTNKINKQKVKI